MGEGSGLPARPAVGHDLIGASTAPASDSIALPGLALGPFRFSSPLLAVAGALLLGIQCLAGHIEITYYVLIVSGFYAVWRLAAALRGEICWCARRAGAASRWPRSLSRLGGWLLVMVGLGLALGAVQLAPMYELATGNFRQGSTTLDQVRGWAWPVRQLITFLLPDAFGNPTHHAYFDIWTPPLGSCYGQRPRSVAQGYHRRVNRPGHEELRRRCQLPWPPDTALSCLSCIGDYWSPLRPEPPCQWTSTQ